MLAKIIMVQAWPALLLPHESRRNGAHVKERKVSGRWTESMGQQAWTEKCTSSDSDACLLPGATMTKAYMLLSSSSAATDFTSSRPCNNMTSAGLLSLLVPHWCQLAIVLLETDFPLTSKLTVMEVGSGSSLASAIGCGSSTDFDRGPFHGRSSDTADRGGRGGCFSYRSATKYVALIFRPQCHLH